MNESLASRRQCLILVRHLPWPPTAGGRLRDWQNVRALADRTDLSVVALQGSECVAPPTVPLRTWRTLDGELLRNPIPFDGREVVLRNEWWTNRSGHPADSTWSPFRASALRRLLTNTEFDFAVIEDITFWRYADIVREFCPIIVDCHNVQSRLEEEYLANVPDGSEEEKSRRRIALATIGAVEQKYRDLPMIVCSEAEEHSLLERGFEREQIAIIHNTLDLDDIGESERSFGPRILFCGMMNYRPNARAALDLVHEIFPRVRDAIAEAQLWIVGMNPTADLLLAARSEASVFITGEVSETSSYFRSAAALSVPLAFGGGTRFKILEAFKYRLPVVSSPKGCEGLAVVDRRHLFIARSFVQHAERLITLIREIDAAAELTREAASLLREHYSFSTAARQWDDCLRRFQPMFVSRVTAAAPGES